MEMTQTSQSQDVRDTGTRYPESVKETAYQIWAFVASRKVTEVCRILASGEYGDPVHVTHQSVSNWARDHGWADRVARDVDSIAPDLRHQTFSELLFAALDGAKYIRRVVQGHEDHVSLDGVSEIEDIRERDAIITTRVKAHAEARKAKLSASLGAVDRVGFSPVGSRNPSDGIGAPTSATSELPSFASMTPDQLREYEQGLRRRKR